MMKRILITRFPYLAVLFSLLLVLTACSSSTDSGPSSAAESPAPAETPADSAANLDTPTEENATLESLCGVDYQSYPGGHHYHADGKPDGKDTGGSLLSY